MVVAVAMLGLSLLGVLSPARAQGSGDAPPAPLTLTDPDALPFSDTQLQQALLARLLPSLDEPGPAAARVAAAGPGAVSVQVGGQSRVVDVGDRTGTAAARVVALVIAELMTARRPSAVPVPIGAPAPPTEPTPETAAVARADLQPAGGIGGRAWRVAAVGGVSKGLGGEELALATLDTAVVIPHGDSRWRLSPSMGLSFMPMHNAGTLNEVSFVSAVARLLGGVAWGPIDLLAGPFVSAYAIGGATAHDGFLVGGEALGRVAAPLSRTLRLAVEARLDGYANRVRVRWLGEGGYATPRVGVGIGVGVAWDWTS
jgi:hypothetical protein